MGAFSGIDSSQGDWVISRTLKIRQPLLEVLAGGDAVPRHAVRPPCPDVEVPASRLQRFCPHLESCPGPQGQGSPMGGVGCMYFEGCDQVFAIHNVQYGAPRAPAVGRSRRGQIIEIGTKSPATAARPVWSNFDETN